MPRTSPRRPPRLVPLAEGSAYSKLSIKTLRRYGVAGRITLYRAGVPVEVVLAAVRARR